MPDNTDMLGSSDKVDSDRALTRREFLAASAASGLVAVLEGCLPVRETLHARAPFDILIKGGSVIDGTGAPERLADLAIRDGKIAAIGHFDAAQGDLVIGATGLKVCPGFIDVHSHVDTGLFREPRAESKVRQGVTTEASGMDGDSPAPLGGPAKEEMLAAFRKEFGEDCPYRDMKGYFEHLEKKGHAQNIVSFVGLGTIRATIVGLDNVAATAEQISAMQREVRMAIEQGCRGVSTGLEYTPGSFASTEELSLVTGAAPEPYRVYATHMRNEGDRLLEAIEEAIAIAKNSGARLQVSHLKAQNKRNWEKQKKALAMLQAARESGIDVHADRYPYLAFSTGLTSLFPLWSRDGGTEKFLARLRDGSQLARIREEVEREVEGLSSWDAVMITSVALEEDRRYQGKTIQQISGMEGVDPFEFTLHLMLKEEARVEMVGFGMDEAGTEEVFAWPYTMIASDAGAYSPNRATSRPHPRAYGTFPRAIAHYQRERKLMSLEEMIRRMTSLPAEKLNLSDRGVLESGKAADIVLFDYMRIQDRATYVDPHQFPVGIPWVLVNGVPVVELGRQTEVLPGRVLRSS
jgi:N-acyl-D-amino-acid deacylase